MVQCLLFFPGWPAEILSLTDKHGITLLPAYIPTHLNVEADYLSLGSVASGVVPPPSGGSRLLFALWSLPEVDLLASSHSTQCQHYFTLETPLPLGALGLNAFSHPWKFQVSYVFPPLALVPLVLSKFLAEHVNGQVRHLILVAPCWMETPWLPTVLSMLARYSLVVSHHKRSHCGCFMVGQVLKGLSYLHLTLWQPSDMCAMPTGVLFLGLSGSGRGNSNIYVKGLPAVLEITGQLVCSTGFTK